MQKIRSFFMLAGVLLVATEGMGASGGPDAFGYTWVDSNEPGGPVYSWIDITGVGNQVIGFADDNSVPLINMGVPFQYYWISFDEIKLGSNGWMSFDDVGNVAHCFPFIPQAGGPADNLLAPLMSDLIFTGANNPAEVYYYYDKMTEQFIVSYINVPYWQAAAPGYTGSNTFQMILSMVDNSITFQYQSLTSDFYDGCLSDVVVGIENSTGNIGLSVFNDSVPPNNHAIKFTYPQTPLIDVIDPQPDWAQNDASAAEFYLVSDDIYVSTRVSNSGNADTTMPIDINLDIRDAGNTSLGSNSAQVAGLMSLEELVIDFTTDFNLPAGRHKLNISTVSSEDLNPNNNLIVTELNVIDDSITPLVLSYVSPSEVVEAIVDWDGGNGGAAVFMQPPVVGWPITAVEMFMVSSGPNDGYLVHIFANDGGDGLPGTLLATEAVAAGSYASGTYVRTELSNDVVVPESGFFVAWEQVNAPDVALGRVTNSMQAVSRRSYEQLAGTYAVYRANQRSELMIRAEVIDLIFANGFD